ncbi:hypothetical protein [Streptomyces sp. NPDC002221]|uniref:hypothetical protein n=1 Tax=Streptomyces sp. NPDC002221 TaxID=3364639 RepID=UPI00369E1722
MFRVLPESQILEQRKRAADLSDMARGNLAANVRNAAELRELGLMLGLIDLDQTGSLVTACPWEPEDGTAAGVPDRSFDSASE